MNKLIELYHKRFFSEPERAFISPCRINLIGEHLDYNGGLVLPASINKYMYAVVGARNDKKISLLSLNNNYEAIFDLDEIGPFDKTRRWCNYPLGIFYILKSRGINFDHGLNIIYKSEIPVASGLSSSAALLDLTGLIVSSMYDLNLSNEDIALLAFEVENKYCGLQCGIMDQYSIALGKKDKALLLDCQTKKYEYKDINLNDYLLVIIVSNVRRSLIDSKYNERVKECTEALNIIKKHYNATKILDISLSDLEAIKGEMDEVIYRRAKHVISEQERVKNMLNAFNKGEVETIGKLLNESHESLRDDYEVSGEYLDFIHEASIKRGALGERMTGAGFAGSSIALIKHGDFDEFVHDMTIDYYNKYKIVLFIFKANISDGIREIKLNRLP